MFEKNPALAESAPLSTRGRLFVGAAVAALALTFAARTTEQVVDANGCTIETTRDPLDLATTPFANMIDMAVDGVHSSRDCGR
jgi:hypothetical protein